MEESEDEFALDPATEAALIEDGTLECTALFV